jgi:hypothetical protein
VPPGAPVCGAPAFRLAVESCSVCVSFDVMVTRVSWGRDFRQTVSAMQANADARALSAASFCGLRAHGGNLGKVTGRPPFEPTDDHRRNVEVLTALGIPQTEICQLVRDKRDKPITENTLRKHFRNEIGAGTVKLTARIGLFLIATIEGRENLPPGMRRIENDQVRGRLLELYMKARCGWVERRTIAVNPEKPIFVYRASKSAVVAGEAGGVHPRTRTSAQLLQRRSSNRGRSGPRSTSPPEHEPETTASGGGTGLPETKPEPAQDSPGPAHWGSLTV